MSADADNRQGDAFVVTIDPVAVIVMCARKSNHLPRRQIFVAAIDRIGKKAISRVGEDLDKNSLLSTPSSLNDPTSSPLIASSLWASDKSAKALPPNFSRHAASSAVSALR